MVTNDIKEINSQINEYKRRLNNTDYMAIKYAEGAISAQDYEAMRTQREAWRANIRYLENELEYLKKKK